tara:strand:+ start:10079 stop:10549 length:471 start_codon:yes stop_codon:yes gene_type:complete
MFKLLTRRTTLLGILAFTAAVSLHYQIKANSLYQTVFKKESTFYTPGQHGNCKWVVHISNKITTEPGDNSAAQIGIPEVSKDGYIAGILQNGPGNSLLFAFKLPTQSGDSPPFIMTATYNLEDLPLKQIKFRVFNSTAMTMILYSTYESCVEATMR